jgi:hypothetical protein
MVPSLGESLPVESAFRKPLCGRCRSTSETVAVPFSKEGASCGCSMVELQRFLRKTQYKALCPSCIEELHGMVVQAKVEPVPKPGAALTEGRHYYLDGLRFVFTEYYHLLRGHCCGSSCRHCAYGNKP